MISKLLSIATVLLISTSTLAAEGTSEAKHTNLMDDLYLGLISTYHGPGVTHMSEPFTQNKDGKTIAKNSSAMYFDSEIAAAYLFTPSIGVGPVVPFFYYPVFGKGFTLGDIGLKIFDRKFFSTHDLNLSANLTVQAPTSDYSRGKNRDMSFALKMTPHVRYLVPDSRYSFGAWTEQKAYFGVVSGKTLKLYLAPYVNYQQSPNFSWNLEFEAEADHFKGNSNWDLTLYQTDIMPGFVYRITPRIIVNPYVEIFTSQKISMNNTGVGAFLSASI